MLQHVLIRIINSISVIVTMSCAICIIGPILALFMELNPFDLYSWYSTILGAYGALKIIGIGIMSYIITVATEPFVDVKDHQKKDEEIDVVKK